MEKKSEDTKKDMDKIFDEFKSKKLGIVVKKARWWTILKIIGISFLVFCVLCAAAMAASDLVANSIHKWEKETNNYTHEIYKISAPDKYIGKEVWETRGYKDKIYYTMYKIIEGKVIYTGEKESEFAIYPRHGMICETCPSILDHDFDSSYAIEDLGYRRYNELGQRVMVFFYPFVKYNAGECLNDLDLLDDIGNDKYMEMALSFDRKYTTEEVRNILPENITVTWYWVDDLSENEKEMLKIPLRKQEEMEFPVVFPPVKSEYTAYGIKLYYNDGREISGSTAVELFINSIVNSRDEYHKGNEFDRIYNNIVGDDGKLTQDDIKIMGAVVTGDSEGLKALTGLPFIKASSLGVVTDKY
ncbi:MAG: anti sigma factor C-terminal domain-containing protein [Actinomycetota bacterium]|nr:anti sigma factor C-terminal domain-containing protein [Actinomycetota bacterium]